MQNRAHRFSVTMLRRLETKRDREISHGHCSEACVLVGLVLKVDQGWLDDTALSLNADLPGNRDRKGDKLFSFQLNTRERHKGVRESETEINYMGPSC